MNRIIISGTGAITADIKEAALLLGYDVWILDPQRYSISLENKSIDLADIPEEFRLMPVILSLNEYPEYVNLAFDQKWVKNHKRLYSDTESLGFKNWTSIIHPSAVVSQSAKIGKNVFINANSTVSANVIISDNVFVNRDASIGHDVSIGSHTNIGPAVTITGSASIYESVFIGAGSIIINAISIGTASTVAAGSVVTRNVESSSLVMGSPARRKNSYHRKVRRKILALAIMHLKKLGLFTIAKRVYSRLKF
jgi:sugar O-acyltransferase (sialic acid O-acetyltransferase NeuD family)